MVLEDLYKKYKGARNVDISLLHQKYVKRKEETIAEALTAALVVDHVFRDNQVDLDAITPQMQEAFDLSFPNLNIEDLSNFDSSQLLGIASNWKGKLFEIEVRDSLNNGEVVGDLSLQNGQYASIAEDINQPGWDLQIFNDDGGVAELLQLKATNSLSYINSAFEKYPGIDIMSTSEIASLNQDLINSNVSLEGLNTAIEAPMQPLMSDFGDEVLDVILPSLPFLIICLSEGRHVFMNKKTAAEAFSKASERAAKTGVAIGVGIITTYFTSFSLLGGVATFLTRYLFRKDKEEEITKELSILISRKKPELLLLKESYS